MLYCIAWASGGSCTKAVTAALAAGSDPLQSSTAPDMLFAVITAHSQLLLLCLAYAVQEQF